MKSCRGVQCDRGEEGGLGYPDTGIARDHASLGGGDVRATLDQGCRNADRYLRECKCRVARIEREVGGGRTRQRGDGMLRQGTQSLRLRDQGA